MRSESTRKEIHPQSQGTNSLHNAAFLQTTNFLWVMYRGLTTQVSSLPWYFFSEHTYTHFGSFFTASLSGKWPSYSHLGWGSWVGWVFFFFGFIFIFSNWGPLKMSDMFLQDHRPLAGAQQRLVVGCLSAWSWHGLLFPCICSPLAEPRV